MMRFAVLVALVASFFPSILSAPTTRAVSDAPFSVPSSTIISAITCPNGIKKKAGGIVYLIHGTGSTGSESWGKGPYNVVLPTVGPGYDICWVDLPSRSLVDAQISAEYVAYGVKYLAPKSATGKVSIIGHSQGAGINPQWALIFWPSIQSLVHTYVALAPDFHGTAEAIALCSDINTGTCNPSVWQQKVGSKYLAAQNSQLAGGGGRALVPTTAIYTLTDDVIQPELPPNPTSYLQGASVHAFQDLNYCGPIHLADHFTTIVDPAGFGLALLALQSSSGTPDISKFDKTYCTYLKDDVLFDPQDTVSLVEGAIADVAGLSLGPKSASEPPLKAYVCSRGFATSCGSS